MLSSVNRYAKKIPGCGVAWVSHIDALGNSTARRERAIPAKGINMSHNANKPTQPASAAHQELSDEQLENVAGGIKMKPVYVTSYQTGGSSSDVVPVDQISLNFSKIEYEYKP